RNAAPCRRPNSHTPSPVVPVPYLSSMPTSRPAQVAASTRAMMENSLPAGASAGDVVISILPGGPRPRDPRWRGRGADPGGHGHGDRASWSSGSGGGPAGSATGRRVAGALLPDLRSGARHRLRDLAV